MIKNLFLMAAGKTQEKRKNSNFNSKWNKNSLEREKGKKYGTMMMKILYFNYKCNNNWKIIFQFKFNSVLKQFFLLWPHTTTWSHTPPFLISLSLPGAEFCFFHQHRNHPERKIVFFLFDELGWLLKRWFFWKSPTQLCGDLNKGVFQ